MVRHGRQELGTRARLRIENFGTALQNSIIFRQPAEDRFTRVYILAQSRYNADKTT